MEKEKTLAAFNAVMPTFAIFQDEKRQQLMTELCCKGEMTVNELTETTELSRPAVSHHLKLMLTAGVIKVRQVGVERHYSPNLAPIVEKLKALTAALEE
ncbi:metalloregulator ArsR/SmtB family transcription factor [Limosilactobacillus reuteri]|uniref:ArsR/SmtB family transcription factor n=1 Tax=Limosilactobacillus reuteri TaxID=1598 RepID=UPI0015FD74BA|nr:metalloregulator ArsR/SmtB family transcription factor [Limosilactobacillus reuteri]MBB1071713.1 helix-turn-helix transcriptional regulator [Limosilactobacillus reuteri]MCC4511474.1 metalloregulator ArsR/SmtB family transcription factor [Limosilactobacillus reuteri]MCC4512805.1 metalloregulator ArsR/SmtB family transcription factor [Limosilactobacillus reuteri]